MTERLATRTEMHPRLDLRHVSKSFGATKALDDVELRIWPREIHGLVGQNGSGKSTLIKIIAGVYPAEDGAKSWVNGRPTEIHRLAHSGGPGAIRFVHQDLGVIPEMTARENLCLHSAPPGQGRTGGRVKARRSKYVDPETEDLVAEFSPALDLDIPLAKLTPLERTVVSIAAALQRFNVEDGLLVLDEPTSALGRREASVLLDLIRRIRARGASVLLISHRLDEILEVADVVTVLLTGRRVATVKTGELTGADLVRLMVGSIARRTDRERPATSGATAAPVLEVRGLSGRWLRPTDIILKRGEILGVAGLPGSGADEVARLLTDARARAGGWVRIDHGSWCQLDNYRESSVALVPPDRMEEGLIPEMSVKENLSLCTVDGLRKLFWVDKSKEERFTDHWVKALDIVCGDPNSSVAELSGGNQQRVLLGRVMARQAKVLVLCEPTVGVDVVTRYAIYDLVRAYAHSGVGMIVSSSDTTDLCVLCDRVMVFRAGQVVSEIPRAALSESALQMQIEGFDGK